MVFVHRIVPIGWARLTTVITNYITGSGIMLSEIYELIHFQYNFHMTVEVDKVELRVCVCYI